MLERLSISSKMLVVVSILILACIGLAGLSIYSLIKLEQATYSIDASSDELRIGSSINQNALELDRAEYMLAANPGTYDEVSVSIEATLGDLKKKLAEAEERADPSQKAMLADLKGELSKYEDDLHLTLKIASKYKKGIELTQGQKEILDATRKSEEEVRRFRNAVLKFVSFTQSKADKISQNAEQRAEKTIHDIEFMATGGIILAFGIGIAVSRRGIVNPLRQVVGSLENLSEWKLDTEVTGTERKDEIGTLARTTQVFKENMIRTRKLEEEAAEAERRSEEKRRAALLKMADEFDASIGSIVELVTAAATQLQSSARNLSSIAEETSNQSQSVASAAEEASVNVETVAAASEELSSSVAEINRQMTTSAKQTKDATREADRTNDAMHDLQETVDRIGEVVTLIQEIAGQTNLLALNATIEAARAGEAGKGFAVVAGEVKALASQTAKATEEISHHIEQTQSRSGIAIEAVRKIAGMFRQISENANAVASAVEEQGAATGEIARNVQEAAEGTRQVTENIAGVTQASVETGRMSNEVLTASNELSEQAALLRREVDKFLSNVREG